MFIHENHLNNVEGNHLGKKVPIGMLSFGPTWPISLVKLPMGERRVGPSVWRKRELGTMLAPRTLAKGKHLEKLQGLGTSRTLTYTMDEHDQTVAAGAAFI